MWQLIVKSKYIFLLYLLVFTGAIVFLGVEGKVESHLLINKCQSDLFDWFFRPITFLGDGIFMLAVGLLFLLLVRIRYGLMIICSFLLSSALVQILKKIVFPGFIRPVAFFREMGIELHQLQGIDYHSYFSFPSGHSTTAFALFFSLALISGNNFLKIGLLMISFTVAFSRVYLSQHFLEDILAGSMIGIIITVYISNIFLKWKNPGLDRSLINFKSTENEQV